MKKAFLFLQVAVCASCFADIVIGAGDEYVIASPGEITISEKLTGGGAVRYTGGGTLILTNGGNDFSGGLYIDAGVVRADAEGALGSGTVTVAGGSATLCLNAAGATFANPIVNTGDSSLTDAAPKMTVWTLESATLTGGIVSTAGNLCICNKNKSSTSSPVLTLDCAVDVSGKIFYALPYGRIECRKKIFADKIQMTSWHSCNGMLELHSPDNRIGTIQPGTANVRCRAANVLGSAVVYFDTKWPESDRARILMDGFPQTVSYLDNNGSDERTDLSGAANAFYSTAPTTLTLSGTGSHRTYAWVLNEISLVVDGGDETFVQRFKGQAQPTAGTVSVLNGTFRVEDAATFAHVPQLSVARGARAELMMTATDAFAAVTVLEVDGTLAVGATSPQPFKQSEVALSVGAEGVLEIPEGFSLYVRSLTVDGVQKAGGTYLAADLPGHIVGAGAIIVPSGVMEASWSGGAESLSVFDPANWGGMLPDLTEGTLLATFSASGDSAVIDGEVSLAGIRFTVPDDAAGFTLVPGTGPSSLSVGSSGVATLDADDAPAHVYEIGVPAACNGVQVWSVAANAEVQCDAGLAVGKDAFVKKAGKGLLAITGTSVMDGGFQQDGGRLALSGTVTTLTGLDASAPVEGGSATLTFNCTGGENDWPSLALNGVTIEKPVWFTGRRIGQEYKDWGKNWCEGAAGTTNVFKGFVYSPSPVGYFFDGAGSTLIMEGGGEFNGVTYMDYNTTIIRNEPLTINSGTGLTMDGGLLRLEVAGNSFHIVQMSGTVVFAVEDALADGRNIVVNGGTVDIGTFGQHPRRVEGAAAATLTGEYPSFVSVRMGGFWRGPVTGGAGFSTRTEEHFVISGGDKASCGDLMTSGGTLEIDSTARWLNGTNVTVCGTGVLKLGASERLDGRKAVLHLGADGDGWAIDIPAGCVQTFRHAFDADGRKLRGGVYGKAGVAGVTETRYAAHFANDGVIRVCNYGLSVTFR